MNEKYSSREVMFCCVGYILFGLMIGFGTALLFIKPTDSETRISDPRTVICPICDLPARLYSMDIDYSTFLRTQYTHRCYECGNNHYSWYNADMTLRRSSPRRTP